MEITYRKNEAGKLERKTVTPSTPIVKFDEWSAEVIAHSISMNATATAAENDRHAAALATLQAELDELEALQDKAEELDVT